MRVSGREASELKRVRKSERTSPLLDAGREDRLTRRMRRSRRSGAGEARWPSGGLRARAGSCWQRGPVGERATCTCTLRWRARSSPPSHHLSSLVRNTLPLVSTPFLDRTSFGSSDNSSAMHDPPFRNDDRFCNFLLSLSLLGRPGPVDAPPYSLLASTCSSYNPHSTHDPSCVCLPFGLFPASATTISVASWPLSR